VTKARYFCENCGAEVRAGASSCPQCRRAFSAVRCPECGHMGKAAEFRAGCPACGYLKPREQMQSTPRAAAPERRSFLSARSSRIAIICLLALLAALLAFLLLRG
jgi:ssDNA-binding Zn-finger/Zn-ribbon topoisomerase 1